MSKEEYFAYLEASDTKSEYFNGEIFDMAGGSPQHGLIAGNCIHEIRLRLKGDGCKVYTADVSVGVESAKTYLFPDLSVVCGPLELLADNPNIVTNPQIIVEVLSPSTAEKDRTAKLLRYMQIPSLREYILIEQSRPQVDVCFMNAQGVWDFEQVLGLGGEVNIRSLGIMVPMAGIYSGLEF